MKIYSGVSALSAFRRKQLLAQLHSIEPGIKNICAEYLHVIDNNSDISEEQHKTLTDLLTYGEVFSNEKFSQSVIIGPRIGTISSWASKATDIAHNSGVSSVNRIERAIIYYIDTSDEVDLSKVINLLHDKMTETVFADTDSLAQLFVHSKPDTYKEVPVDDGVEPLIQANKDWGLALSDDEIDYLYKSYSALNRNPSDVELMMFSVVNSEHCRHKIFNANWTIDGQKQEKSLFKKIKNTYEKNSTDILSAYSDNAAVLRGSAADRFYPDTSTGAYGSHSEEVHIVTKVETHNHPTAVAPNPGAATGVGGEIRDEGATGRGAKPKMGLTGFTVSNLHIPNNTQPWEVIYGKPSRTASALNIMLEAPIGGAAYSNEFGRPNLAGYFRTYEQADNQQTWGYHKPIMLAGGVGNIKSEHVAKHNLSPGSHIIVLGGPAMLIGLGGGTASSVQTGKVDEKLDFASVQRANAEAERRAQEVINACWALGDKNPIITIHDVGAGGLSNALPELVHDSNLGAEFHLRKVPSDEPGMTPLEIWCNEAQERYVLGISDDNLELFKSICEKERCTYAVVGTTTEQQQLIVKDELFNNTPVNIPMSLLFGNAPKMTRSFNRAEKTLSRFNYKNVKFDEVVKRVLQMPAVGSKKFLITIGDRSVGGLTVRDQMVGPWQVPVSDVAVTSSSFGSITGEAMAIGERSPLAIIDSAASARIAVGESITNIAAAPIEKISDVKLSANWMAAADHTGQNQDLYDAVTAVGEEFCPAIGVTIPVGKDSLSMRTSWQENGDNKSVTSPLSLVVTSFSPTVDTRSVLTPQLSTTLETKLVLIDLGEGNNRLGGSIAAQAFNAVGDQTPDISPEKLIAFFNIIQKLNKNNHLLAYHDRSDGGLFTTVCEMAFASRCGLALDIPTTSDATAALFNEELGAVIQIKDEDCEKVISQLKEVLGDCIHIIGSPTKEQSIEIRGADNLTYSATRAELESLWAKTSYNLQKLRDNTDCAEQEYNAITDNDDQGISPVLTYNFSNKKYSSRPKVAVLREQGVNGQVEMANAFYRAGFDPIDVHLQDITSKRFSLKDFSVLAVCGGFSYGDVLGAGEGWAKSILHNQYLRSEFQDFFERPDTLTLGTCNGCQMLSRLKELIPGAEDWPKFKKNISEQFEARLSSVKISKSPSILLQGMEGSILPIQVAHGEGRAKFDDKPNTKLTAMHYVDHNGNTTERYPLNPNGSNDGATAFTSQDGRATILMPHPERGFLSQQFSWHPNNWAEEGPWLKIFQNARDWIATHER